MIRGTALALALLPLAGPLAAQTIADDGDNAASMVRQACQNLENVMPENRAQMAEGGFGMSRSEGDADGTETYAYPDGITLVWTPAEETTCTVTFPEGLMSAAVTEDMVANLATTMADTEVPAPTAENDGAMRWDMLSREGFQGYAYGYAVTRDAAGRVIVAVSPDRQAE